ncbi:MAG: hypothetical protein LBP28_07520, partial [Coriobacteriales bacterium]|nr:hypothetical protein [Coriobacteriales bacterium]
DDLKISVLAVTHTCAPVALVLPAAEGNDGNSGKGNDTGGSGGSGGRGGNGGNGGSDDAKVRPAPLDSSAATAVAAATAPKACAIINNGAAGMPNFSGQDFGLVSRIALSTHTQALYRAEVAGVYVEALPLTYNNVAFKRWFNELWPPHSPAALSYQSRIEGRIDDAIPNALLGGFTLV